MSGIEVSVNESVAVGVTEPTGETAEQHLPSWSLAQAFTGLHICIEVYVIISLIFFGVRTNKLCAPWDRSKTRLLLIGIYTPIIHLVNIAITEILLTTSTLYDPGYDTTAADTACTTLVHLRLTTYSMAMLPSFVFLWYRHRIIYRKLELTKQKKLFMEVMSGISISLLLVSMAFLFVFAIITTSYLRTPYGCVLKPLLKSSFKTMEMLFAILFFVSWILMSVLLVFLLVTADITGDATSHLVHKVIKKTVISIIVCVLSYMLSLSVSFLALPGSWPRYVTCVIYDCSIAVNSLSVVLSYLDHWDIFFSWLPMKVTSVRHGDS